MSKSVNSIEVSCEDHIIYMKGGISSLEKSKRHHKTSHFWIIRHKKDIDVPHHDEDEDERKESLSSEDEEDEEEKEGTVWKRLNQIRDYWQKQKGRNQNFKTYIQNKFKPKRRLTFTTKWKFF